ncbi:hypothetical protein Y1Q_0023560 [Alligator mississippiensis]|uniref:Uncharacterized protein n=1 Tax=Alligator mississippiensis TaxID=8496 RepID=A0A151MMF1_ALLMI|nr:hypothetical protein Y1Q_0023560 [Alligator mississippiensis]
MSLIPCMELIGKDSSDSSRSWDWLKCLELQSQKKEENNNELLLESKGAVSKSASYWHPCGYAKCSLFLSLSRWGN